MKIWFLTLLLCSTFGSANAGGLPEGLVISQQNKEAVLKYLRPVLISRGGAGRLYYSTACKTKDDVTLPFPEVDVQAPSKGKTGVAALREIFGKDKRVVVPHDRSGMIRVTIGQPISALLQTKIHSVSFKQHEQYNGELAIFAILNSKEVEAAMRRLGFALDEPVTVFGGGINVPEKGVPLPHLPTTIKDMTMDQALDVIAKTFGGIVIYETCEEPGGKRLVSLDFVQIADL